MRVSFGSLAAAAGLTLAACGAPQADAPEPLVIDASDLNADVMAERLSEAIRFQTVSEMGNPRASFDQFEAFRDWLSETFPRMHTEMTVEDLGDGTLWFTLEGSDPDLDPVVLLAHQDVVPVEPGTEDQWTHPPFAGEIAEGYVWGRGALDMKGVLVSVASAMESLLEDDFAPVRTLHVGFGHDEEVGGAGAQAMAARLEEQGRRAWFVLDEGGTSMREFPITGGPAVLVGVAEKGYLTVQVTATARGGHSSVPPAETAVGLLGRAVAAITDAPFEHAIDPPMPQMLRALAPHMDGMAGMAASRPGLFGPVLKSQLMDDDNTRAAMGTTIAPTIVSGGSQENILPQTASATINLRLHPRDSSETALAHMRDALSHLDGVEIEPVGRISEPPFVSPTQGRAWEIVAGAAAALAPEGAPVVPNMLMAATDSRAFVDVTGAIYRYAPLDMAYDDMTRIHGDDERIRIQALPVMADFHRTVIAAAGMDRQGE